MASSNTDGVWLSGAVGRDPFHPTRSLLLLRVGQETDADGPAPASLPVHADVELPLPHPTKGMWTQDGLPAHGMFHVFGGAPVPGSPVQVLNPWVEGMFSPDGAAAALDGLLARGPGLLAAGRVGVILVRRGEAPAPLFCVPEGDWVVGVGVFSTLPAAARTEACAMASELAIEMHRLGCKRYLSGYFSEEPTFDWSGHYADRWPDFRAAKAEHHRHTVFLNSGSFAGSEASRRSVHRLNSHSPGEQDGNDTRRPRQVERTRLNRSTSSVASDPRGARRSSAIRSCPACMRYSGGRGATGSCAT